jgi:hypothetical protein
VNTKQLHNNKNAHPHLQSKVHVTKTPFGCNEQQHFGFVHASTRQKKKKKKIKKATQNVKD